MSRSAQAQATHTPGTAAVRITTGWKIEPSGYSVSVLWNSGARNASLREVRVVSQTATFVRRRLSPRPRYYWAEREPGCTFMIRES